jgi:hypothetical protein
MNIDPLLKDFLKRLNDSVKRKVTIVAIGGNALIFFGAKRLTNDVDIVCRSTQPEVSAFCKEYLRKYKIKVHAFIDGLFKTMRIKDYLQKAMPLELPEYPNLKVKILNVYDIILTKINRWLPRDQEDIGNVLFLMEISKSDLDRRYKQLLRTYMGPKNDFIKHYEEFKQVLGNKLHP